jgi:putative transposase
MMETIIRGHKIRLYPNNKQITYFRKACGTARFAYNWALERAKKLYDEDKSNKFNEGQLRKDLNSVKKAEFPWMMEVTKCAPQLAIKNDLNSAFRNFFEGITDFPTFHRKGVNDSFSISNDQFSLNDTHVHIPKLGEVRLSEPLRFEGKMIEATISSKADIWYISIQVEIPKPEPIHTGDSQTVGIDLGISTFAVLSDGTEIESSHATAKYEKQLRRLNKELSRRKGAKKGEEKSKNFMKTKRRLARLHAKIANLRNDETHKATSMITKKYDVVCIEDLNVKGMMANHHLAKSVADMSFSEFRRQLVYKSTTTGTKVVVADRFYPSSKTCSNCGAVKETLSLSERTYHCDICGFTCDRDLNAAINLEQYAVSS